MSADVAMQSYFKSQLSKALKSRGILAPKHQSLLLQQRELDGSIQALVQQRKALESDVGGKRKALMAAKPTFKEIQAKKKKIETPVLAELENILLQYNISAAAYHGGKFNGMDCHEFIQYSKLLYREFETYLLSTSNADRCSNEVIVQTCFLYREICVTLDCLASKFRMKNGEPQAEDYEIAIKVLKNLAYSWKMANMSFTPKLHSLLAHAIHQMRCFDGMHQISARVETRVSRMKDKDKQALVHSKMEAIQFNVEVTDHIEQSKQ
jgi:hypothetical protein